MSKKIDKLINFNLTMGALHAVQALIVSLIANDFSLPINASFLSFNESTQTLESGTKTLFDLRFAYLIVGFFVLSSLAHLIVATVGKERYQKDLKKGVNVFRWFEYSLSASLMMVGIAMLAGMYDAGSLIMVFGLTAIMNLLGLVMEIHNQTTKKTNWLSYWIGCLAGIIPWLVVGGYFWASASESGDVGAIPTFVYVAYASIFVFFNTFAINMVLQYKKVGKWSDYLYGERAYIILSLVAKSALAWQVYAGTLQPA